MIIKSLLLDFIYIIFYTMLDVAFSWGVFYIKQKTDLFQNALQSVSVDHFCI